MAALVVGVAFAGFYALFSLMNAARSGGPVPLRANFTRLTAEPGVEWFPSISPDGEWIVYSGEGSGNRDIYLRSVGGQNAINLTGNSQADDDQPAFSPDGDRVAFRSERDGGGIFIMGRTGEAVRRVTRMGFKPSWSPDGTRLTFVEENVELNPQNIEMQSRLWVVDAAGGDPQQLNVVDAAMPSWSPHGHRIAYTRRAGDPAQGDVWTVPVAGGEPTAVTSDIATDWSPAWSPDGTYLYFASDRGGSMNLWRVRIDEESGETLGEPEPITTPATSLAHISVSADGRHIVYCSSLVTSNIQTATLDPSLGMVIGQPAWVTTGSRRWSSPDPSPDGAAVAFYSLVQPEGHIYVVNSDGTELRQITGDAAIDRMPRWSPDGQWIAFFSNRSGPLQAWRIRRDGSDLQQMSQASSMGVVTWSPDGSRMAGSRGGPGVYVFDPHTPWDQQSPQLLPEPDSTLGRFGVNSWSPNGERLAGQIGFSDTGIVVYDFRSGAYERLTDVGQWPVWLPDSRHLLFVTGGKEFRVVDSRSRQLRTVFAVERDVIGPPRLSHDGREMFFSRRVTEGDVWLVTLGQ
jgi:Tol biopolymer transport system component